MPTLQDCMQPMYAPRARLNFMIKPKVFAWDRMLREKKIVSRRSWEKRKSPRTPSLFLFFAQRYYLNIFLQASPERSTRTQQKEFQTYVLDGVMDHLLAADVLLGNTANFNYQSIDLDTRFWFCDFSFFGVLFCCNLVVLILFPFPFLWYVNGVANSCIFPPYMDCAKAVK